jgi:hypothetical protein
VIRGKIYVVGGYPTSGYSVPLAGSQIYNPVNNTWSSGAALPTGTAQAVATVVNNVLYVIGGTTDGKTRTSAAWAFNPKTKTWSAKAAMPTARADAGAGVENNIIYVIGGASTTGGRLNTVESYNPATDKWTTEAPPARWEVRAFSRAGRNHNCRRRRIYGFRQHWTQRRVQRVHEYVVVPQGRSHRPKRGLFRVHQHTTIRGRRPHRRWPGDASHELDRIVQGVQ